MPSDPIPIHVGSESPETWDGVERTQNEADPEVMAPWFMEKRRPSFAANDIDWAAHGLTPRWVGEESANCAAAIDPSQFHSKGADEFARFVAGAERRGDDAIVVARMEEKESSTHSVFGNHTSITLIGHALYVSGKQLGTGVELRLAEGLRGADKDLAVRFADLYREGPLWALELTRTTHFSDWSSLDRDASGELQPLVVDELGEPVVAVWISPARDQRVYVLPGTTPEKLILDWLANRAIPEFAPVAHRQSRAPGPYRDLFPSRAEADAARTLAEFDLQTAADRAPLVNAHESARHVADDRRHTLLFGTGSVLEDAVAECLRDAGFHVAKVDEMLGGTKSADLLATVGERRILIEVKSGGGKASEDYYTDLETHMREWLATGRTPVDGGALVVNHQMRTEPSARDQQPYSRPEFLEAQVHAILTTRSLLDMWRTESWGDLARTLGADTAQNQAAKNSRGMFRRKPRPDRHP